MTAVRTFVAVTLDAPLHDAIADLISRFSSSKTAVKWVAPENAHVTLKFLGNVDERRLTDVFAACEKAAKGLKPINIDVRTMGCFPNMRRPRVIWIGIEEGADLLERLQHRVEEELETAGFPREDRTFQAHITIGRVRDPHGVARLCDLIEAKKNIVVGSMHVEKVSVMKSTLLPTGPTYTELKAIPLR